MAVGGPGSNYGGISIKAKSEAMTEHSAQMRPWVWATGRPQAIMSSDGEVDTPIALLNCVTVGIDGLRLV